MRSVIAPAALISIQRGGWSGMCSFRFRMPKGVKVGAGGSAKRIWSAEAAAKGRVAKNRKKIARGNDAL
jgi:hypothetical protein